MPGAVGQMGVTRGRENRVMAKKVLDFEEVDAGLD
jgi:hypothetical protein